MPAITVVIITLNEEQNIGRCLDSVVGLADEVLVLDSGSTDRTIEICHEKGAKVVPIKWKGYAATKNEGNAMASNGYILSLDADEALSDQLKSNLLAIKNQLQGAYTFNRLAYYCGKPIKHCGWYPDRKMRLFPKGTANWEGAYVHETLNLKSGIQNQQIEGDLLHFTYYTIEEHRERAAKYARLASEKLIAEKKKGLLLKAIFSPSWRFIQMYFLKLGFLDGWRGFMISKITSREVWWKYFWALKKN